MTDVLHPGDRLSELLDGRLAAGEDEAVRAHLLACRDCAAELDGVRAARAAVRSLPAVEPPPGFLEALLDPVVVPFERPARRRVLANAAVAVAAGLVLVVGMGGQGAPAVSAEVGGAVQRHAATISAVSAGLGGPDPIMSPDEVSPTTLPHRPLDVPEPYLAPRSLGAYRLAEAFRSPRGVHLLYEKGPFALSVFQQEGSVDFGSLPSPGERIRVAGDEAWRWTDGRAEGRVLVLQRDGIVITMVADEPGDAVLDAARALPDGARPLPLVTRLRRAGSNALEVLSPAG